jgi:hypothetical protein
MLSRQRSGESMAGKNDTSPANPKDPGRAQAIEKTATSHVSLTAEQKQRLSGLLKGQPQARRDSAGLTLSIGASVPPQIELANLPDAAADVLHGYNGDKYLIIGDQLVIVDREIKRIVALIPNVA